MKILTEEEVYNGCKNFFIKNEFTLLAGDPPRGIDPSLPFIEIKCSTNLDKGSKDSYKPDLIVFKNSLIYLVECKPKFDINDKLKLEEILTNSNRIKLLYQSLIEKNVFTYNNIQIDYLTFSSSLKGILAYSGEKKDIFFNQLILENFYGKGTFHEV